MMAIRTRKESAYFLFLKYLEAKLEHVKIHRKRMGEGEYFLSSWDESMLKTILKLDLTYRT